MIDKLSLTTQSEPDIAYLKSQGKEKIDDRRIWLYKYMYDLPKLKVFCYPHKYSDNVNARIPFTKIDINPKHYVCFAELEVSLKALFNDPEFDIKSLRERSTPVLIRRSESITK